METNLTQNILVMINIIIAEDQKLVRDGIKMLLSEEPEFNVIGEACNGIQVLDLLNRNVVPDIILSDVAMPEMDGMTMLVKLQQLYPQVKVVFLSIVENFEEIADAINQGASGFLTKDINRAELLFSIKYAVEGGIAIPGKLTIKLLTELKSRDCLMENKRFSSRELEVLNLIAEGRTNNEMAEKLFLSKRTIEGHRQELLKKTSTNNSASLIRKAVLNRLIR